MSTYSFVCSTQLFELGLSPNELVVYLVLISKSKNTRYTSCYPSIKQIAKSANISERTVQRALDTLENEHHLITRQFRFEEIGQASRQSTTVYVLHACPSVTDRQMVTPPPVSLTHHKEKHFNQPIKTKEEEKETREALDVYPLPHAVQQEKKDNQAPETALFASPSFGAFARVSEIEFNTPVSTWRSTGLLLGISWDQFHPDVVQCVTQLFFKRLIGLNDQNIIAHPLRWFQATLPAMQATREASTRAYQVKLDTADHLRDVYQLETFAERLMLDKARISHVKSQIKNTLQTKKRA